MKKTPYVLFWRLRIFILKAFYNQSAKFHKNLKLFDKIFRVIILGLLAIQLKNCLPVKYQIIFEGSAITELLILVLIVVIIWIVIQKFIKNTGGEISIKGNRYIARYKENKRIKIDPKQVPDGRFIMINSDDDVKSVSKLNVKLYKKTIWQEIKRGEKLKRNSAHIKRNNGCLLLIKDDQKNVGFTHIFPVNINTWYRYKQGLIGDNKFAASLIVPSPQISNDQEPFGLIIFSLGISDKHFKENYEDAARSTKKEFLMQGLAVHLSFYLKRDFKHHEVVPVLFQNMDERLINYFKGFETNGVEYSKDGAKITCFEIENTFFQKKEDYLQKILEAYSNSSTPEARQEEIKKILEMKRAAEIFA